MRVIKVNFHRDRKHKTETTIGDVAARILTEGLAEKDIRKVVAVIPRMLRHFDAGAQEITEVDILVE